MNVRASSGIERRPADDGQAQAPAEALQHRFRDEPAQQRHEQTIERARAARRDAIAARDARGEQHALHRRTRQRPLDPRVKALEDPRHGEHHGRRLRLEVLGHVRDAAAERDPGPDRERQVVAAGALEHVRQRQDRQEEVVGPRHSRRAALLDVGEDVAVRQHHAARAPGGPGGEADRRQRVGRDVGDREVAALRREERRGTSAPFRHRRDAARRAAATDGRHRRPARCPRRCASCRRSAGAPARAPRTTRRCPDCRRRRAERRPAPCRARPGRWPPSSRRCARTARCGRPRRDPRVGTPPASVPPPARPPRP